MSEWTLFCVFNMEVGPLMHTIQSAWCCWDNLGVHPTDKLVPSILLGFRMMSPSPLPAGQSFRLKPFSSPYRWASLGARSNRTLPHQWRDFLVC